MPKIEEWVEASKGKIRADRAHEKLLALGYQGSDRSTRRAVAQVRAAYRLGHVRVHRPWITEPGMWLQYDFGDGPVIEDRKTVLFVAWLAWCRYRIVIALRDRTAPTVFAALDRTFRIIGGAPTYVLTDNEKTVTVSHIAGVRSSPQKGSLLLVPTSSSGTTTVDAADLVFWVETLHSPCLLPESLLRQRTDQRNPSRKQGSLATSGLRGTIVSR